MLLSREVLKGLWNQGFQGAEGKSLVELPEEDKTPGMCGRLNVAMYGTRDAASNWESEYTSTLEDLVFQCGKAVTCIFHHVERDIKLVVHGDDFTTVGSKASLDWFKEQLSTRYELKEGARLGPGDHDDKEGRVLNRIVRWIDEGLVYEADPRQHEKLVQELGLEGAKAVATPCVKPTMGQIREDVPLAANKLSHFRALAAGAITWRLTGPIAFTLRKKFAGG